MDTKILSITTNADRNAEILHIAGEALRHGDLVAFPTETVYGLGAIATDADAVARIFIAKGRPTTDPLIVHLADIANIAEVTGREWSALSPMAYRLAQQFWPGPLTLILPRGPQIPALVSAGLNTIGVRVPSLAIAQALIRATGSPIAAPSANRFGHTSPTIAQHVFDDLHGRIPYIIDGGATTVGVESTIVDVTNDIPRLLRPGGISVEALEEYLGQPLQRQTFQQSALSSPQIAPGSLLLHYAPSTELTVYAGHTASVVWQQVIAEVITQVHAGKNVGVLVPDEIIVAVVTAGAQVTASLGSQDDSAATAQHLFAGLRFLEEAGVDIIISGVTAWDGLGLAVQDRLWRATAGQMHFLEESNE